MLDRKNSVRRWIQFCTSSPPRHTSPGRRQVRQCGLNSASTVTGRALLSPFPQYNNGMSQASADYGNSAYHSLQVKMQKRFTGGASIGLGYTYSKLISSIDTLTGWLESSAGNQWGVENPNDLSLEKALSSNDVKNRLVLTYADRLP